MVRDAIRKVVLKPSTSGPVAIWDGEPDAQRLFKSSLTRNEGVAAQACDFCGLGSFALMRQTNHPPVLLRVCRND